MKRSAFPFLFAAIVAVVAGFSFQHDPSIDASAFEPQFREAARRVGLTVVNETAASVNELPLPLTVQWHPRRWHTNSANRAEVGVADGVDHYGLVREQASRVDCFVRYLDGRVQVIAVHAARGDSLAATDLRMALQQKFPGIPVKLQIQ